MVLKDEIPDFHRQFFLFGTFQTVGHVSDNDFRALLRSQHLVRVHIVLVFGEESRVVHFTDVVVQRAGTRQLRVCPDFARRLRHEV